MPHFAAHPDDKVNQVAGKDIRVKVAEGHKVFIGGIELPGWIETAGLSLEVGDDKNFNILEVRFLVGEVDVDESVADDLRVRGSAAVLRDAG